MSRPATLADRAVGAMALGVLLGVIDAALHPTLRDWGTDPVLASRGLLRLVAPYGIAVLAMGIVFSWRKLLWPIVVGFALAQGLAWCYRHHPEPDEAWLLPLLLSLAAGTLFVRLFSAALGRTRPRRRATVTVLACVTALGCLAWLYPETEDGSLGEAPLVTAGPPRRGAAVADRPNVLLLTFDTLRADRLGVYGYDQIATPHFDALANGGVVFTRALVHAPLTPPSHASIFTGTYPSRHGIRAFEGANRLRSDQATLAEILQREGYATVAVVAAAPLAPGLGLERGFDRYDFTLRGKSYPFYGFRGTLLANVLKRVQLVPDRTFYRNAGEQTDRAISWLERERQRPIFLWVHYFDVHDPYAPPARHLDPRKHPHASPFDLLSRSYLYDSELSYLDEQVGRLVTHLRRSASGERGWIIVGISDHGEGLGEHNFVGHRDRLYDEQIRGVFFINAPQQIAPGRRVTTQVRAIDVLPSLLDLLELPRPDGIQGVSLLRAIRDPRKARHLPAFSEVLHRNLFSASDGRYKLIVNLDTNHEELFDVTADPQERRNLAAELPEVSAALKTTVLDYVRSAPATNGKAVQLSPEVRDQLRALGYVDG